MTLSLVEILIIVLLLAFIIGLAFRTGYSRGRHTRPSQESETPAHVDHTNQRH